MGRWSYNRFCYRSGRAVKSTTRAVMSKPTVPTDPQERDFGCLGLVHERVHGKLVQLVYSTVQYLIPTAVVISGVVRKLILGLRLGCR